MICAARSFCCPCRSPFATPTSNVAALPVPCEVPCEVAKRWQSSGKPAVTNTVRTPSRSRDVDVTMTRRPRVPHASTASKFQPRRADAPQHRGPSQ